MAYSPRGRREEYRLSAATGEGIFQQARHDLDEIARLVPDIELKFQDSVPAILDRSGRTRQREKIGALGDAGAGARLHGRCADLAETNLMEQHGKSVDLLFEERTEGFHGDIATLRPGPPGCTAACISGSARRGAKW